MEGSRTRCLVEPFVLLNCFDYITKNICVHVTDEIPYLIIKCSSKHLSLSGLFRSLKSNKTTFRVADCPCSGLKKQKKQNKTTTTKIQKQASILSALCLRKCFVSMMGDMVHHTAECTGDISWRNGRDVTKEGGLRRGRV